MGKLSKRSRAWKEARARAREDDEFYTRVEKDLATLNWNLDGLGDAEPHLRGEKKKSGYNRKEVNLKARKVVDQLKKVGYPTELLEQCREVLTPDERNPTEKGAAKKPEESPQESAQGSEEGWSDDDPLQDIELTAVELTARELARRDRKDNILGLRSEGSGLSGSVQERHYYLIGRCLIRLLTGCYGPHLSGEDLLASIWLERTPIPASAHADRFVRSGGMDEQCPPKFLAKLGTHVPNAVAGIEHLLTAYNVLVRAEGWQERENERKRVEQEVAEQEADLYLNDACPILVRTSVEDRLMNATVQDRMKYALKLEPYLFECGRDHLARAVFSIPQKRYRRVSKYVSETLALGCQTVVVIPSEGISFDPRFGVHDHELGGCNASRITDLFPTQSKGRTIA